MRILYLGNNWLGWQVLKWLKEQGEDIVGLVVHPPGKQRYAGELLAEAGLPAAGIFEATRLNESGVRQDGSIPAAWQSATFFSLK